VEAYDAWNKERADKQARLDELAPRIAELTAVEILYQQAVAFEQAVDRYNSAWADYVEREKIIIEKQVQANGWKNAKTFLAELRLRVKGHLAPSLSRVTSHLLTQMTGGARTRIDVTPEFDITVDNQPLQTLSGSGKACANLALRIGLGQVLTGKVLSLFIGDELDASMNQERAE
jgi:exonuclease SbcC